MKTTFKFLAVVSSLCAPLAAFANSYAPLPSEIFVVDGSGKYIVPRMMTTNIAYLGGGIYCVYPHSTDPARFYDRKGQQFFYKLPADSIFSNAFIDPAKQDLPAASPDALRICFMQKGRSGICDRQGQIIVPAVFDGVYQYLGEDKYFVGGPDAYQKSIVGLHGKMLGTLKGNGTQDNWRMCMTGATQFTEGRLPVQKGFGNPVALIDDQCKFITTAKFMTVGRFKNGMAVARLRKSPTGPYVNCFINRAGQVTKEFPESEGPDEFCIEGNYVYHAFQAMHQKNGLIDARGEQIIKPTYDNFEKIAENYYLATNRDSDAFDLFDLKGKLLLHSDRGGKAPYDVGQSTKPTDIPPLLHFLLEKNGAAKAFSAGEDLKRSTGCAGLLARDGHWIIEPVYSLQSFAAPPDQKGPINHYSFQYAPKAFSPELWQRWMGFTEYDLYVIFTYFLKENNLIKMPVVKVEELLGKPTGIDGKIMRYLISKSENGSNLTYLEIKLDGDQRVFAWRKAWEHKKPDGLSERGLSEWEERDMTPGPPNQAGWPGALVPKTTDKAG